MPAVLREHSSSLWEGWHIEGLRPPANYEPSPDYHKSKLVEKGIDQTCQFSRCQKCKHSDERIYMNIEKATHLALEALEVMGNYKHP